MTVSPIPSLGPTTREEIARLIEEHAWSLIDGHRAAIENLSGPGGLPNLCADLIRGHRADIADLSWASLSKADAILALFPVEAGDVGGWRMVPVEPTPEMHAAGNRVTEKRLAASWTALEVWRVMLAASPPLAEGEGK